MPADFTPILLAFALFVVCAIGLAWLLKLLRCPGAPIVGGLLAGVLLGPTVLGRAAPDFYERALIGGVEQRRDVHAHRLAGFDQSDPQVLEEREAAWEAARWDHQQPLRIVIAVLVGLALLGCQGRTPGSKSEHGLLAAATLGLWSSLLPGGAALLCFHFWFDRPLDESLLVGAAVAIGLWRMTAADREAADRAEVGGAAFIRNAARFATVIALVGCGAALIVGKDVDLLPWFLPLLIIVLSWALPHMDHAIVEWTALWVALPPLAALAMARVDVIDDFTFWPIALLLILSGDGRWFGAFLGAMLPGGRRGMRTMRLVMGTMAAGPTQLAVTALAAWTGAIEPPQVFALLAGVLLIEITAPARAATVDRILEAEAEIQQLQGEDDEQSQR